MFLVIDNKIIIICHVLGDRQIIMHFNEAIIRNYRVILMYHICNKNWETWEASWNRTNNESNNQPDEESIIEQTNQPATQKIHRICKPTIQAIKLPRYLSLTNGLINQPTNQTTSQWTNQSISNINQFIEPMNQPSKHLAHRLTSHQSRI